MYRNPGITVIGNILNFRSYCIIGCASDDFTFIRHPYDNLSPRGVCKSNHLFIETYPDLFFKFDKITLSLFNKFFQFPFFHYCTFNICRYSRLYPRGISTLTVLTNLCAGDTHMLLYKYANAGILPDFFPFVVKSADLYALYPYNYST